MDDFEFGLAADLDLGLGPDPGLGLGLGDLDFDCALGGAATPPPFWAGVAGALQLPPAPRPAPPPLTPTSNATDDDGPPPRRKRQPQRPGAVAQKRRRWAAKLRRHGLWAHVFSSSVVADPAKTAATLRAFYLCDAVKLCAPERHDAFVDTVLAHAGGVGGTAEFVAAVRVILRGHPDLFAMFRTMLPRDCDEAVVCRADDPREQSAEPGVRAATHAHATRGSVAVASSSSPTSPSSPSSPSSP